MVVDKKEKIDTRSTKTDCEHEQVYDWISKGMNNQTEWISRNSCLRHKQDSTIFDGKKLMRDAQLFSLGHILLAT
jgi:hypothetical protein